MADVTLYGPYWSAYTRTVRLTLIEAQVEHNTVEVDFSKQDMPADQIHRHPFGKVPALRHKDFLIYETAAICRYIDSAFGSHLQPTAPQAVGRMAQIIGILDAYLSAEIRLGYVTELLIKPMLELPVDKTSAASAKFAIIKGFAHLSQIVDESSQWLVADRISLADLHAAPLFDYLRRTDGGDDLIDSQPKLARWWSELKNRPSMLSTQPDLSVFRKN